MANTVNDVMNVIASPDYGIKNIAGTNQEILAILSGVHNSKNNIHAIVDDVKHLLQKLVDTTASKNKPIEIGNKSSKINHKNIQDILDETKGIRKAIDNLAKILLDKQGGKNMPAVAKLSDKASEKVAKAMIKDMEKQKKGGGMAALVDAFTKLKDISLKDIIFGKLKLKKITKLFKNAKEDLKIKEKDLNAIIKLINAAPEMVKSLSKIGWKINRVIKNDTIKKLSDILVGKKSILTLSKAIEKNKKVFNNANKVAKSIKELMSSLNKLMRNLVFASLWAKLASMGIKTIEVTLNKLIPLSKKLTKNEKDFKNASKAAKKITALIGNILVTSIFLTIAAVTGIPAILGALVVSVLVDTIVPIAKKLSRSNKHMSKAVGSSLMLVAFTGIMVLTSLALSAIAKMAVPALLGSFVVLGVVSISILTFKIINKAKKNILIGSIMMALMSISLLLFGVALGKITKATENVSFKQIGMIAAMTVLLTGCVVVLGIPQVAAFVMLGSLSMAVMSIGLLIFSAALGEISKATENLKFKQILLVSGSILALGLPIAGAGFLAPAIVLGSISLAALSLALRPFLKSLNKISKMSNGLNMKKIGVVASSMMTLGLAVAGMAILTIPIGLGAIALGSMGSALYKFVKSLKIISDMGSIPKKEVRDVIGVMKSIGKFFKENALSFKATRSARRYKRIMRPFGKAVQHLVKLNKMGGKIPIGLIYQTLAAMKAIGNYFIDNPIKRKVIRQARKYKRMMRPFGKTVAHLSTLKKMGSVPMKLVYQTLNAMSAIANYYANNPIKRKSIRNARKYKRMMRPFGKTVAHLSTLKKMGSIPMKLVYQTLDVMSTIANYYKNNPIKRKAIRNARKYKRLMRPFGKTVGYLATLKKMGSIPMKLVYQALDVISTVVGFYRNQNMGGLRKRWKMKQSARMITSIVSSFGVAVNSMKTLSDLRRFPSESIWSAISSIRDITWFYANTHVVGGDIEGKSRYFEFAVDKFTTMAKNIQDKFGGMKEVDNKSVRSVIRACRSILNFYTFTYFFAKPVKIGMMNATIKLFVKNVKYLKDSLKNGFGLKDYISVCLAVKSMKKILKFYKRDSLNIVQARRARRSLSLITGMATALSTISKINPSDISVVGDSLTNALNGVQTIDISQVQAVTDMFNAFKGINESENIINKFAESVKEFTASCKELTEAMNNNIDAINNSDTSNDSEGSIFERIKNRVSDFIGFGSDSNNTSDNTQNSSGGIRIINVDEIANTIAAKINGAISVDIPDTQVQLTINGSGGNEWIISKY